MSSTLVGTLIFPFLFLGPQTDQMGIDAQICFADEFAIESASANARFVPSDQQNRVSPRVKREGDAPRRQQR